MMVNAPHFLLFPSAESVGGNRAGRWHFILESVEGSGRLEAADEEPEAGAERLQLLAVVRGLEALEQPSRVTLVTTSRQIDRGLRDGLEFWRSQNWRWECYGRLVPMKNGDLWQRIDRALDFHQVECRVLRVDGAHAPAAGNSAGRREVQWARWWAGRWRAWVGQLLGPARRWADRPLSHATS